MEILTREKEFKEKYKPFLNEHEQELGFIKIEDLLNNLKWQINKKLEIESK